MVKQKSNWLKGSALGVGALLVGGLVGGLAFTPEPVTQIEYKNVSVVNETAVNELELEKALVEGNLTLELEANAALVEQLEALNAEPEFRELEFKAALRESALEDLESKEVLKEVADVLEAEYGIVAKWDDISLDVEMDDSEEIDESFEYDLGGVDFVDPEFDASEEDAEVVVLAEAKGRDVDDDRFKDLMVKITFSKEETDFDFVQAEKA
jgi:hypothetical protein